MCAEKLEFSDSIACKRDTLFRVLFAKLVENKLVAMFPGHVVFKGKHSSTITFCCMLYLIPLPGSSVVLMFC